MKKNAYIEPSEILDRLEYEIMQLQILRDMVIEDMATHDADAGRVNSGWQILDEQATLIDGNEQEVADAANIYLFDKENTRYALTIAFVKQHKFCDEEWPNP